MIDKHFIDDVSERVSRLLRESPAADLEKNLKALLAGWFDRLQLVSREDFDVQRRLLERANEKLAQLEKRISELEASGRSGRAGK